MRFKRNHARGAVEGDGVGLGSEERGILQECRQTAATSTR
jgi:hypothetical protein